jgi:cysteine protease ATG4
VRLGQRAGGARGVLEGIAVYVAQDGAVYKGDVEALCAGESVERNAGEAEGAEGGEGDFSLLEVPGQGRDTLHCSLGQEVEIDGETWCLEQATRGAQGPGQGAPGPVWKALVLLVPMRLGTELLNPLYASCIKALFTLESCLGIIGGKPKHSLYFVGFQDDDLIQLDPHRLQDSVDTLRHNFSTDSFHCRQPRSASAHWLRADTKVVILGFLYLKVL